MPCLSVPDDVRARSPLLLPTKPAVPLSNQTARKMLSDGHTQRFSISRRLSSSPISPDCLWPDQIAVFNLLYLQKG